jgi:hypothetical protein
MINEPLGRDHETGGDHSDTSSFGQPTTDGEGVELTLDEVLEVLGWADGEFTALCHKNVGGAFTSSVVASLNANAFAESLPERADVWFSVNPTLGPARQGGGRGGERQVTRWAALYLDVDVKEGAFPDLDKAAEFVSALSEMVGTRPSVLIFSGHGLQPLWPIEDGQLDTEVKWAQAYQLSRRFGRLAHGVASEFSASLDNVSDLTRILRVPQKTNWKDPANPVPVRAVADVGGPLTVDAIEEFLDEWAPEIGSDESVACDTVSAPDGWVYGPDDCAYVRAMVEPWGEQSDKPKEGRHQWATDRAVRLAAAHRLGCITEDGLRASLKHLEVCLAHWCQTVGTPRDLHYDEIGSAYRWATTKVATFTDERTRQELGKHQHDDADRVGGGLTLPPGFWQQRPTLDRIRQIAYAEMASPDAVLGLILSKLSASVPPRIRIDTGVRRRRMPLNTYVALVGKTGGFKSSAADAVKESVTFSRCDMADVLRDRLGLFSPVGENIPYRAYPGTAQGIVENFMGEVEQPVPDGSKVKPKVVRQQVRTNVLLESDEGNWLVKELADARSKVGEILRELWTGADTGQGNAKSENRRGVRQGEYSFGMTVGFQLKVLGELLKSEDVELGTPQRIVCCWTGAPDLPDQRVAHPGDLVITIPSEPMALCEALKARVWDELRPRLRAGGSDDDHDSQRIAVVTRLAAEIAILGGEVKVDETTQTMTVTGRSEITEEDWALAELIADTSRSIKAYAIAERREKDAKAQQIRRARNLAESIEDEDLRGTPVGRGKARIIGYLTGAGALKWTGKGGIRAKFNNDDVEYADKALTELVESAQVIRKEEGRTVWVELTR